MQNIRRNILKMNRNIKIFLKIMYFGGKIALKWIVF